MLSTLGSRLVRAKERTGYHMLFNLQQMGDDIALITESRLWTYSDLLDATRQLGHVMKNRSLIFHLCKNSVASITGYVAFLNHRCVPVMLDADMDGTFLTELIEIYRPSYLWLPKEQKTRFPHYRVLFSIEEYFLLETNEAYPWFLHEKLALLMTTSGSTGSPKFVRLSYDNIQSNTESIIKYLNIGREDRAITNLPMYYVYGLSIINTHLATGASLVVTECTMFQKSFWKLLKDKEVTSLAGVPYTYEMLNRLRFQRMDFPFLRTLTQAGGKLDARLHQKFAEYAEEQGKRFFVMYGAAEATARMGYLPSEVSLKECGKMGIPIPGGKFELLGEDEQVIESSETVGELIYEGPNVMMGYADQGMDLARGDDLQGRLVTGDLAKRDDAGYYTIIGRKKRFLKMFGKRINLYEIEQRLRQECHVVEVACAGADDDLYVFLTEDGKATEISNYLKEVLRIHPTAFRIKCLEQIPKNSVGKTRYRELEKYYEL